MTRKMKDSGVEWIGEIPEDWIVRKLKNFAYLKTGTTPSTADVSIFDGNFKWYTPSDFNEGIVLKDSIRKLNEQVINEKKVPVYPANTVLIVGIGATIGKIGYIEEESSSNQQITAIIPKGKVYPKYLMYLLLGTIDWIKETAQFTTMPILNNQTLGQLIVLLPSNKEQSSIAKYLDQKCRKIDETTEKEKQVIEKLKAYKQSVITEAVTKGLNPDVSMKDSGIEWIGEIPEHWEYCRIKYNTYLKGRIGWQGLKASEFIDEGPYLVTGTDFQKGRVNWETCYHISEERFYEASDIHLRIGDLLITKDGTVGKLAYIDELPGLASLNSHLLVIRPTSNLYKNEYLYWVLSSSIFTIYTGLSQDGSIMASLSQEKINNFNFPLPSLEEQEGIISYLDKKCLKIDNTIAKKEALIQKLTDYKKSLIYECVTGKREV